MRRSCEACMQVLRDSKDSLLTVMGGGAFRLSTGRTAVMATPTTLHFLH